MNGTNKLKRWLKENGFTLSGESAQSEYYKQEGVDFIVRISDHMGRPSTQGDKYVTIIRTGQEDRYVLIINRSTRVSTYKEIIRILRSLVSLNTLVPEYLVFSNQYKKSQEDRLGDLQSKNNALKLKMSWLASKFKGRLEEINKIIGSVPMNNGVMMKELNEYIL